MRKQLMIIGMSDSGTNWLVRSVQASARTPLAYYREFFNPICNLPHAATLAGGFGCEVHATVPMIARPAETQPRLEAIYSQTWEQCRYTFTKENYSVWKIPFFTRHFDMVGVYREPESLWPPARYRVVTWYNAVYESICLNRADYTPEFQAVVQPYLGAQTIREKAEAGHLLSIWMLKEQAKRWRLPVITYGWLQVATEAVIAEWVQGTVLAEYVDPGRFAEGIVSTRRPPDRSELTEAWAQGGKGGR